MKAEDFTGTWKLAACYERDEDGRALGWPMGKDPKGLLIYTADGHMSANLMRTSGVAEAPGDSDAVGYAGTWRISGNQVIHIVDVTTPVSGWAGSEQIRDVADLRPGHLTLEGTVIIEGKRRTAVVEWTR